VVRDQADPGGERALRHNVAIDHQPAMSESECDHVASCVLPDGRRLDVPVSEPDKGLSLVFRHGLSALLARRWGCVRSSVRRTPGCGR